MNQAPDTAAAGNGGTFDPRQAATLLDQTARQARREFQPSPPWLLATRAVLVLAALGGIWLSVRGQHPYRGPTAADLPVLIGFIVANFAATVAVRARATAGIHGKSRLRPAEIAIMAASWAATVVVVAAVAGTRGIDSPYPTIVLIIPGLAWAALMAARADWGKCATGTGVLAVAVAGLFAGPVGAWAVAGGGLCAVLLARAVAIAWRQRAARS
jgi:hypothetical protein